MAWNPWQILLKYVKSFRGAWVTNRPAISKVKANNMQFNKAKLCFIQIYCYD